MDYANVKDNPTDVQQLHDALEAAVKRQLMSDVPYGVLLSGGLDSSITSAIAKKYAAKRIETNGKADAWWPQLHSFAIGLKDAPDLISARKVADAIGTVHHEIHKKDWTLYEMSFIISRPMMSLPSEPPPPCIYWPV